MFKVLDDDHYIMGSHQRILDVLWLHIPYVSTTPRLHDQFLIRVALGPHMATQARRGDLLVGRRARGKQVSIVFPSPPRRRARPTSRTRPSPLTHGGSPSQMHAGPADDEEFDALPVVPLGDKKLRACLVTGLVKTEDQARRRPGLCAG